MDLDTHLSFDSKQWAQLRANATLTVTEQDIEELRGVNDNLTLSEVEEIYLPLSRLLSLYVAASQELYRAGDTFLGKLPAKVPFVIGMAGSVAVGKSTAARVLKTLLSRWPNHPRVDLVTTDGFLYPNEVLESKGLMDRKGFPESYDQRSLVKFLYDVKSGTDTVTAPVYSHLTYDRVPDAITEIQRPDILLVEGLTVLQTGNESLDSRIFVSDFFDFTIYLDAAINDLRSWYIERFLTLRNTAFSKPESYFHKYCDLSDSESVAIASDIWSTINERNLIENIEPTRPRADLILTKRGDHQISNVRLRRL